VDQTQTALMVELELTPVLQRLKPTASLDKNAASSSISGTNEIQNFSLTLSHARCSHAITFSSNSINAIQCLLL